MSTLPPPNGAPIGVELDAPLEVARWRPLVHWILAIPHFVVAYFLNIASSVVLFIAFFTVLFSRNVPEGLHSFAVRVYRYQWRVNSYALFMRELYPAFGLPGDSRDPGDDPARLWIERPSELKRFAPLYKWFLAIPHYIALMVLIVGAFFVIIAAGFAVLFTGRWPEGMRTYLVGVSRWQTRVQAYVILRDEYPPFTMS